MATAAIAGMVLFTLSSVYFSITWKREFNTALLVSIVTLLSYVLLLEGSLATTSPAGQAQFFPRWILYGVSHALIAYQMTRLLGKRREERAFLLVLVGIVMGTFALASHFSGEWMVVTFAIAAILHIGFVSRMLRTVSEYRGVVANYLWLGWTALPLILLISPEGTATAGTEVAAWLYLLFDVVTKTVFYADVSRRLRHHPEPASHQSGKPA